MLDLPADGFHQSEPPVGNAEENGTTSIVGFATDAVTGDGEASHLMTKKTRDLPNLADCHSCGFRINTSNCVDKLRTLNSEWRIVLLCRKCYKRCARGVMCTYCFGEVSGEERFRCGDCCCCIHKDCVSTFSEFAPWSYFDCRSSSVCVDCWLPSRVRKLRNVEEGRVRISNSIGSGKRWMERGERDEDYAVEKRAQFVSKPQMTFKAREKSLSKPLVAKMGLGKENGGISSCYGLGQKRKGVDDAELAFQLHRVMNSSPRISRGLRPSSSSHVNLKKKRAGMYIYSGKISTFGQRKSVGRGGFNVSIFKGYDAKDDTAEGVLKEGQGSSNNSLDYDSSWNELDLPKPELKFTYIRKKYRLNADERHGQYMFKYSRQKFRLKQLVYRKYTYLYDRSSYESETSSTAIILHGSNEIRKYPDSCILALPVSACERGSLRKKA